MVQLSNYQRVSPHLSGDKSINNRLRQKYHMYFLKRGAKKGRYSGGISIYYKNCFKDQIKVLEKNQSGILKQYMQYCDMRYFICYFFMFSLYIILLM